MHDKQDRVEYYLYSEFEDHENVSFRDEIASAQDYDYVTTIGHCVYASLLRKTD